MSRLNLSKMFSLSTLVSLCFVCGLFLASCATLVSDNPSDKYGPIDEAKTRSGVVVYDPNGLRDLVDARKDSAYQKIVTFCGSRNYKITKEEDTTPAAVHADNYLTTITAEKVHAIYFTCKEAKPKQESPAVSAGHAANRQDQKTKRSAKKDTLQPEDL